MKRIIITMFAAMCITAAFGQEKIKLAVYVQGAASEEQKKVVGARIISAIVKSEKYAAVERTADFLAELRREQGYQYSGNVDDGQIIKLGKQFGVKMVCVADVGKSYLFARMIDIETGLVASVSGMREVSLSDLDNLISEANVLINNLLQNVTNTVDKQKIAIYVTKTSDTYKAKCVNYQLVENITNTGVFITVDRTSDFLAELRYQGSGNVDDRQLSRLGKQFGVNLVCVIDITKIGNDTYTTVRIINVETGMIISTSEKKGWEKQSVTSKHPDKKYIITHKYKSWEYTHTDHYGDNQYGYVNKVDYYLDIFSKNLDEITAELMQQLVQELPCIKKEQKTKNKYVKCCEGLVNVDGICKDPNICIAKDQKITSNLLKCCEGLINVSGVCRDHSWIKNYLGIEVNKNDVEVRQGTIVEAKCKTCPEGWRLPTKAEFEKMLTLSHLDLKKKGMYLTSDFIINAVYDKKSKSTIHYYKYYVWDTSGFSLKTIYHQSYPKKGNIPPPYYYNCSDIYVRCVRD